MDSVCVCLIAIAPLVVYVRGGKCQIIYTCVVTVSPPALPAAGYNQSYSGRNRLINQHTYKEIGINTLKLLNSTVDQHL